MFPRDIVCLRNISINTPYKEGDDDDDDDDTFLETRNGNIRSSGKPSTPKAEDGYCNETTQSGPLTYSQSHKAQNTVEHTEVKQRRAWTKEEIRQVIWCWKT